MQTTPDTSTAPEPLFYKPLWLEVCGWSVIAGFPSPAADHTQKRIDLNEHLIRNKEATYGRGTVKVSTQGAFSEWQMKQERKSPNYTTDLKHIPSVA